MIKKFALFGASALLMISGPALSHDGPHPSDAQIAHITYTAGQLDLEAGKQALAKSRSEAVRAFAQTMVRDHAAVNEQALALVKQLGVTPEANATSEALTKQAKAQAKTLGALNGAAFDRAYPPDRPRQADGPNHDFAEKHLHPICRTAGRMK